VLCENPQPSRIWVGVLYKCRSESVICAQHHAHGFGLSFVFIRSSSVKTVDLDLAVNHRYRNRDETRIPAIHVRDSASLDGPEIMTNFICQSQITSEATRNSHACTDLRHCAK
jgi:hypothetical protein